MMSCVATEFHSASVFNHSTCSVRVNFLIPFKQNVFYVTAIGQDAAFGSNQGASQEGSEMSFGISTQDRFGVTLQIGRVIGRNSGGVSLGFVIQAIGLCFFHSGAWKKKKM